MVKIKAIVFTFDNLYTCTHSSRFNFGRFFEEEDVFDLVSRRVRPVGGGTPSSELILTMSIDDGAMTCLTSSPPSSGSLDDESDIDIAVPSLRPTRC